MADEKQTFYPKDFEYLFVLNPNKMSRDEIVNYINSCSNGSDRMFIYNSYYFMLKQIPSQPVIANAEKALGDKKLRESAKRELISSLKYSSAYCDVWLSPQERFMNYLGNLLQLFFAKVKPRKYEYTGSVDMVSKRIISGWAMNLRNPEERVIVDIYGDNEKKLSICADAFREDLKLLNIGDGFYGMEITPVPEELLKCSSIQLITRNDNTILPDNMLGIFRKEYDYIGVIDLISKEKIMGWVINRLDPEERVMVNVYGDDKEQLSICADLYREDLKLNGVGDGCHAFFISPVPEELLQCSKITVKTSNYGYTLIDNNQGIFRD